MDWKIGANGQSVIVEDYIKNLTDLPFAEAVQRPYGQLGEVCEENEETENVKIISDDVFMGPEQEEPLDLSLGTEIKFIEETLSCAEESWPTWFTDEMYA